MNEPDFITEKEFKLLLRAVGKEKSEFYRTRDKAIFIVLFHTGLRLSEVVNLDTDNIDFEGERLRGVKRKGGNGSGLVVNEVVLKAVSDWLETRAKYVGLDEPALFISDRRKRIDGRSVQVLVNKYAKKKAA